MDIFIILVIVLAISAVVEYDPELFTNHLYHWFKRLFE